MKSLRTLPGFVSRLLAFAVDIFAMATMCLLVSQAVRLTGEFFRLGAFAFGRQLTDFATRAGLLCVVLLYLPISWAVTGRSLGKALMGLRIVRVDGSAFGFVRSLVRFAGYWLSALPFGLGFLASLFDGRRRTFHDRLAGTVVVYDERNA
jgi:uncharacterized RDD family membrane protein YckC